MVLALIIQLYYYNWNGRRTFRTQQGSTSLPLYLSANSHSNHNHGTGSNCNHVIGKRILCDIDCRVLEMHVNLKKLGAL